MKNFILMMSLLCATSTFTQTISSTILKDTVTGKTPQFMQLKAGSCGSPDGGMNSTITTPPNYTWLQNNGYCNPSAYGNNPTVCWTFTPTSSSVSINSGYSTTGCNNVAFNNFNLYNSSCTFIGSGFNFTGLTPGNTYTWCMTGLAWGGGPGCIGFTDFCPYYFNNTTLPIELVEFDGKDEEDVNKLWWVTASEINNDYFTVERSEDGIHWQELTRKKGAGNSNTPILYEYIDNDPYVSYTYYRLSQTDFDGVSEMFKTIAIQNESSIFYTYTTSPRDGFIYLSSPYYYEFYNSMGQLIRSGNGKSIDTNGLTSGIYILKIGSYTQKFFL